jgi:asparagine synthase (glutamine-hydrolysing)
VIRERIASAVAARRVADVPIGAFLSGGLDSSIIVAHLAAVSPRPVQTFAIGYAENSAYDETSFARIVANRFGTDHHEYRLTQDEIITAIPAILEHLGEPFGDSSIIPTTLVSRFARQKVTVALSGDGGDELFGGYWRYLGHEAINAYRRIPALFRRTLIEPMLNRWPVGKSGTLIDRMRQFRKLIRAGESDPLHRHLQWAQILPPEITLFDDVEATLARALEHAQSLAGDQQKTDPLNSILRCDLQYSLPGDMLHKVDLASMSQSLEVRVPLLDRAVVEAVLPISSNQKLGRGQLKKLLIDAYRDALPEPILQRRKKGFEVPIGEYLRGPLRPMFRDLVTRDAIESLPGIRFDAVEQLLTSHLQRRGEHADALFTLLSIGVWLQNQ